MRKAVELEIPLQLVGTINADCARLAERAGFKAIYLSGAGVANASFGLPDLGITTLNDVCEDARRITAACPLPLLVDADTGWGGAFSIARTIRELMRAGAAGYHLYPLSAFRAMSQIATRVYETIRTEGTQKEVVSKMQTRAELYDVLNYYSFEDKLDQLFSNDKKS